MISDEIVAYKGKQLSFARHVEKVGGSKNIPKERKNQSVSSDRTIFVSQIEAKQKEDYVIMIFESRRNDGGKIKDIKYNQEQGTAVITFEDPRGAFTSFIFRLTEVVLITQNYSSYLSHFVPLLSQTIQAFQLNATVQRVQFKICFISC